MKSPGFVPLPDPISEEQVSLELNWSADARTRLAIERQAKLMGYTPKDYLHQALAAAIAGKEEATGVSRDGRLACAEFSARFETGPNP